MSPARLRVVSAGPYVTFQDGGRFGNLRFGVPASGPMDRLAHKAANLALGNDADATAIEVSPGGLSVECTSGEITVAVAGGGFEHVHADSVETSWRALTIRSGDRLTIRPGPWGSWAYLAVAGHLDAPRWLGHTATHLMSGFGGGSLVAGHDLEVADARTDHGREGEIPVPAYARPTGVARVTLGPQNHHFAEHSVDAFCAMPYTLTSEYDRMGVRLAGQPLLLRDALSIPSEPIVRGSIQVAGDGVPTLLFADHQTTGGYPKIATVVSTDVDGLTQLRAGDNIGFEAVTPSEAVDIARDRARAQAAYLELVAGSGRTLTHRLRSSNLIGGVV